MKLLILSIGVTPMRCLSDIDSKIPKVETPCTQLKLLPIATNQLLTSPNSTYATF